MDYLPITVDMKERLCLIVGGGEVAARKLKHLLKAKAMVKMVSHEFNTEIIQLAEQEKIELIKGDFTIELLKNVYLVIAATDDNLINKQVSDSAKTHNIWVNVVDSLELSTFIMPAIIDRSPLLIAVSSSGVSPVLARKLREKIEWLLPANFGQLMANLKRLRPLAKKKFNSMIERKRFSEWYIEKAMTKPESLESGVEGAIADYQDRDQKSGKVYLVGAGPGDAELLTVKALKILQKADVVLYDALVSRDILDCVRKDATLVHVGKRANRHFVTQNRTNELLVEFAEQGMDVVRLKGGDPFIFGRGGEEAQVLVQANIEFEIVPGITAAIGCAGYAGIPLTHRDFAQSVRFITGHEQGEASSLNWVDLAKPNQTLVFYMGLLKSQRIAEQLIGHGRAGSTPVAIIEKGTTSEQRVILGKISELPELAKSYDVKSPALIIVGEVASLANELQWYSRGSMIDSCFSQPDLKKVVNL
ncbi:siroheme synthase CysG [Aliikangiella sp. G2MR2-5]|uniref:siroheme synthase CysG n=1 Tax=Aliikangiella sp. G2MR2-5 TaxID=2788943 RepID=UPI0018A94721|nr:siroheme synthase CysG [Aliikangiella sp. G2MR2-5]